MFPNGGIFKKRAMQYNPFILLLGIAHSKEKNGDSHPGKPHNRARPLRLTEMGTMQKSPIRIQKKIPEAHIVHLEAFRYLSLYCTA